MDDERETHPANGAPPDQAPVDIEKGSASAEQIREAVDQGDYVTVKEVANALGYTPAWITSLCQTGRIAGVKPTGGQWRIPRSEMERLQREGIPPARRVTPQAPAKRIQVDRETADRIAAKPDTHAERADRDSSPRKRTYPLFPLPIVKEEP